MSYQVKNFNLAVPDRLAAKHLMHRHSLDVFRSAPVQVTNDKLKACQIGVFILHSV